MHTLRLSRAEHALIELQLALPAGARVLYVRYTRVDLVCAYQLPTK